MSRIKLYAALAFLFIPACCCCCLPAMSTTQNQPQIRDFAQSLIEAAPPPISQALRREIDITIPAVPQSEMGTYYRNTDSPSISQSLWDSEDVVGSGAMPR